MSNKKTNIYMKFSPCFICFTFNRDVRIPQQDELNSFKLQSNYLYISANIKYDENSIYLKILSFLDV